MTRILHRQIHTHYPTAVGGKGIELIDAECRRYIDASGGAAVSCLGHGHPDIQAALHAQLDKLAYAHTSFFTTGIAEALADRLVADAPAGISHAYFVSGGSEAIEAALKMARQYFVERGEPQRRSIIARRQSYHGNTLGALDLSGRKPLRRPYEGWLGRFRHLSAAYPYRAGDPGANALEIADELAAELERAIVTSGPATVAAFVAEPIVGATLAAAVPPDGYWPAIAEVCRRHGVLLIADEVMTGFGRTGTMFACEHEGIEPDLIVTAKGIADGLPLSAVTGRAELMDAPHVSWLGGTYGGNPVACAAALATIATIEADGLVQRAQQIEQLMKDRLHRLQAEDDRIGDVRGRGAMIAMELVKSGSTQPDGDLTKALCAGAHAAGVIVLSCGTYGNVLRFLPPLVIGDALLTEGLDLLESAFAAAVHGHPSAPPELPELSDGLEVTDTADTD
jgi:4-aminobutyrate aminotransferase